ncbi:hypothetical protein OAH76_01710 [Verrucomicrobia bacterium]|nr:hypothetical protein [Verrucomicrobiota bacterium]MDB4706078.1 hypothetical protein [Verrucomicrobiota bacterium]MDB4803552.1 hypothetical protein [Verrucomicrobiota bacterium]MDG1856901.1 hypothetical protein [Verrucomicrobiota bacterium]
MHLSVIPKLTLLVFFLILFPSHLWGVIISSGDGSRNTAAPGDDSGRSNVCKRGSSSGIYPGNRWVLIGKHVGAGSLTLGETPYNAEAGTAAST